MPSLLSNIATTTALAFSLTSSVSAAQVSQSQQQLRGGGRSSSTVGGISAYAYEHMLSLGDFQSVLRTSLDDELDLIAASSGGAEYADEMKGECRHCHDQQELLESSQSNVRRRRRDIDDMVSPSNEEVWKQLQSHAWTTARLLARDTSSNNADDDYGALTLLPTNTKQVPRPFLICSTTSRDVYSIFRPEDQKYLHVPTRRAPSNTGDKDESDYGDSCAILTTTANWAYKSMKKYKDVIVQPLVDVMKILPGTMDSVGSEAWRVPFTGSQQASSRDVHQDDTAASSSYLVGTSNATTAAEAVQQQHWERTLTIDITPGLLAHSTENDLLDLVNIIMTDVQEMSEVGWTLRQESSSSADDASSTGTLKASWQEEYLAEHSLQDVPSLTEMFSLTSPATTAAQEFIENERIVFYNSALANGLESTHGCASMFSTLLIQPRHRNHGLYTSFDLVLNPKDAPPAQDLESSASNVDCVRSLVVGLSVHPSVMSLESNLPRFHGWNFAI